MAKFNPIQINLSVSASDHPGQVEAVLAKLKAFDAEPLHPDIQKLFEVGHQRDAAYRERNQLVAVLSKLWPSHWAQDEMADPGWQHVIFIDGPTGQLSWHVSDEDFASCFGHLEEQPNQWDGHTTAEKYRRLAAVEMGWVEAAWP